VASGVAVNHSESNAVENDYHENEYTDRIFKPVSWFVHVNIQVHNTHIYTDKEEFWHFYDTHRLKSFRPPDNENIEADQEWQVWQTDVD
jgi:hypothetical protein